LYVKKASYHLNKSHFANFITLLKNTFDEATFNLLANTFIGGLGKKYSTIEKIFITNDWETVCAAHNVYLTDKNKVTSTLNDIYFVKLTEKNKIYGDNAQIFRQILSQGLIQLLEMIETVYNPLESVILDIIPILFLLTNPMILT
jgi:hypothetical protein